VNKYYSPTTKTLSPRGYHWRIITIFTAVKTHTNTPYNTTTKIVKMHHHKYYANIINQSPSDYVTLRFSNIMPRQKAKSSNTLLSWAVQKIISNILSTGWAKKNPDLFER